MPLRVLLIEDEPRYARLIREVLQCAPVSEHRVTCAETLADGLRCLQGEEEPDVVLLDLGLPDAEGLEAVVQVRAHAPLLPLVVLSGEDNVATALESMRVGAQEYLVKGQAEQLLLPRTIQYAIERKRAQDFEQLLVGIVSHDLRSPLQTIGVTCATLQRGAGLPADPKLLGRIAAASARASSLVHDLLDLTSVRLGRNLPIRVERIDLGPLVRQAVEEFQGGHPALRIDYATDGSAIGFFDPARVSQVISNLLRNATQHGDANQPVEVSITARSREIELRVRNRGPAIPAELLPHLFKPLRRSAAANVADGSVGLGLFIVNEIARAHGGTVRVTSTERDGTTFLVTLERERPSVRDEERRD